MQDTIKPAVIVPNDSLKQLTDTSIQVPAKPSVIYHKPVPPAVKYFQVVDTTSVCERNPVADITFYDSLNLIREDKLNKTDRFPFVFVEKNVARHTEARASLSVHLKPGEEIADRPFHHDWLLAIILIAGFLYSVIHTTSRTMLPEVTRFFFFRGINDPSSRDIGGLFNWQATLLNLITFFNIGLFLYYAAEWYDIIPGGISEYLVWLISVSILILAVTLRHFMCIITGSVSGQREVFREYLLGIYQSYRLSGIILFLFVILISYTTILPAKILIPAGFVALLFMYLIRIIRLFLIFINRSISIFYWILYLCSLEILPFLILLKYSFGVFDIQLNL